VSKVATSAVWGMFFGYFLEIFGFFGYRKFLYDLGCDLGGDLGGDFGGDFKGEMG
jgi:hypothetical protein